jgi:hypothetical protein
MGKMPDWEGPGEGKVMDREFLPFRFTLKK